MHCCELLSYALYQSYVVAHARSVDTCSTAESLAESERTRDDAIRSKMASRANSERGKLYAGGPAGYRAGDDFGMFADAGYNPRRGCVLTCGSTRQVLAC